jgi:YD repeat-containing protein
MRKFIEFQQTPSVGRWDVQGEVNCYARLDRDRPGSNSQIQASESRSSQDVLEAPAIHCLTWLRFEFVSRASQNATKFIARLIAAKILFFCILLISGAHPVQAGTVLTVEAKILFWANNYPGAFNLSYFDTPQEAFANLLSERAARPPDGFFYLASSLHQCPEYVFPGYLTNVNGQNVQWCAEYLSNNGITVDKDKSAIGWVARCPVEAPFGAYVIGRENGGVIVKYLCDIPLAQKVGDQCAKVGNPAAVTNGSKSQIENDYFSATGLSFTRNYLTTSDPAMARFTTNTQAAFIDSSAQSATSPAQSTCFQGRYIANPDNTNLTERITKSQCFPHSNREKQEYYLLKPDGLFTSFLGDPSAPTKPANINESAIQLTDAQGIKTWKITREDDSKEIYSAGGLLQSKTTRSGQITTFTYSDAATPISIAPRPNLMLSQTDPFGHTLQWRYRADGLISKMIDPASGEFDYAYDANFNLTSVTYPPESSGARKTKIYHYEDVTNIKLLTGITDENNKRFSTYSYDTSGRVKETKHFAMPTLEVNKYQLSYAGGQTTVIDPLNTSRIYTYTNILNYDAVTGISQPCSTPGCTGNSTQSSIYNTNGNLASRTDFNNNKMCYTYDLTRNLETARIEGLTVRAD